MKKIVAIILSILTLSIFASCAGVNYKSLTAAKAKEMIDGGNVIILDVRTYDEFNSGHLKGALNLDFYTISEGETNDLLPDTNATILVYCRSGNRSKKASAKLAKWGYKNIYDIGGYDSLKDVGIE